jgi:hypothetical protein
MSEDCGTRSNCSPSRSGFDSRSTTNKSDCRSGHCSLAGRFSGPDVGLQLRHRRGWLDREMRRVKPGGDIVSRLVSCGDYHPHGRNWWAADQPHEQPVVFEREFRAYLNHDRGAGGRWTWQRSNKSLRSESGSQQPLFEHRNVAHGRHRSVACASAARAARAVFRHGSGRRSDNPAELGVAQAGHVSA